MIPGSPVPPAGAAAGVPFRGRTEDDDLPWAGDGPSGVPTLRDTGRDKKGTQEVLRPRLLLFRPRRWHFFGRGRFRAFFFDLFFPSFYRPAFAPAGFFYL